MNKYPRSTNPACSCRVFAASTRTLSITLALLLVITPVLPAQQPTQNPAPVPAQIASARTVFVSNGGGDNYFDMFTDGADRAYNILYADLLWLSQYQLVSAPAQADLVFEIRSVAPAIYEGKGAISYNPQLILSILDPQTRAVLWTTSANVRALGTKKHRDRGFDQSMAVLVYKLAQVTGQPLTAQQAKAVKDNSRIPTAAKVILVAGAVLSAGFGSYVIYRATHPPALQQPLLPPFPPFPPAFGTKP